MQFAIIIRHNEEKRQLPHEGQGSISTQGVTPAWSQMVEPGHTTSTVTVGNPRVAVVKTRQPGARDPIPKRHITQKQYFISITEHVSLLNYGHMTRK